jgi:signal transduction histidine kinase
VSQLTSSGIAELRRYVGELKDSGEHDGGLVSAVQRFGRKFTEATRIVVCVEAATAIPVSDRLAAEVFQMVAEGLSNIRRHTSSAWATIRLACHNDSLILRLENANPEGTTPVSFLPRSITERATALGGNTHVEWNDQGDTVVIIEIPL